MAQLKITLIRSGIGSPRRQRAILVGLGLTRLRKTVVREDRPEIRGMLRKIQHLIQVDEVAREALDHEIARTSAGAGSHEAS